MKHKDAGFRKKIKKVLAFFGVMCYDIRAIEDCRGILPFDMKRKR